VVIPRRGGMGDRGPRARGNTITSGFLPRNLPGCQGHASCNGTLTQPPAAPVVGSLETSSPVRDWPAEPGFTLPREESAAIEQFTAAIVPKTAWWPGVFRGCDRPARKSAAVFHVGIPSHRSVVVGRCSCCRRRNLSSPGLAVHCEACDRHGMSGLAAGFRQTLLGGG